MSGVQDGTAVSLSEPPAGPLETHLALPNRMLEGGACVTQPRRPTGSSAPRFCFAIWVRGLLVRSLPALASPLTGGSLLASTRRT